MGTPNSKELADGAPYLLRAPSCDNDNIVIPDKPNRCGGNVVSGQFEDALEQTSTLFEPRINGDCDSTSSSILNSVMSKASRTRVSTPSEIISNDTAALLAFNVPPPGSIIIFGPPYCFIPATIQDQHTETRNIANRSRGTYAKEEERSFGFERFPDRNVDLALQKNSCEENRKMEDCEQSVLGVTAVRLEHGSEPSSPNPQMPPHDEGYPTSTAPSGPIQANVYNSESRSRPLFGILSPSPLIEHLERDHPHDALLLGSTEASLVLPILAAVERDDKNLITFGDLTKVDILFGRGGGTNQNPGNVWFRKLMERYRKVYCTAQKGKKSLLARNLCNYVRLNGGRFLEQTNDSKACIRNSLWYECGDARAHSKVGQTLREGTASIVRETLKRNLLDTALGCEESNVRSKRQHKKTGPPKEG